MKRKLVPGRLLKPKPSQRALKRRRSALRKLTNQLWDVWVKLDRLQHGYQGQDYQ